MKLDENNALSELIRELDAARNDPVSYTEDEMYAYFGVDK